MIGMYGLKKGDTVKQQERLVIFYNVPEDLEISNRHESTGKWIMSLLDNADVGTYIPGFILSKMPDGVELTTGGDLKYNDLMKEIDDEFTVFVDGLNGTIEICRIIKDMVNHPSHYNKGGIEVLDIIEAYDLDYKLGNVIKYILRSKYKGKELEDLKKAKFYLEKVISDKSQ